MHPSNTWIILPLAARVHRAGDVVEELGTAPHWWKNLGREQVVLYAVDVADKGRPPSGR